MRVNGLPSLGAVAVECGVRTREDLCSKGRQVQRRKTSGLGTPGDAACPTHVPMPTHVPTPYHTCVHPETHHHTHTSALLTKHCSSGNEGPSGGAP